MGDAPKKVAARPLHVFDRKTTIPLHPKGTRGRSPLNPSVATLLPACGPLPLMMPRVAHFSEASPSAGLQTTHHRLLECWQMDLKRRKYAKTASGVPADGPQTTETRENGVWGASGWTANDENRQKRRLECRRMDRKRRKHARNGVWGAGGWTANDENTRKRRLGASGWTANDGKRVKALFVEQREKYFWQATLGYGAGRRERIIFRV